MSETGQGPAMGMRGTGVTGHGPQPRSGDGPEGSLKEWRLRLGRTHTQRRALGGSEGRVSWRGDKGTGQKRPVGLLRGPCRRELRVWIRATVVLGIY